MTRLTSTPLTPTGSRAEACQPLRVFCAAWHGHDHGGGSPWRRPVGADKAISAPLDSDKASGRPVTALYTWPACSRTGYRHQARQGRREAFTGVLRVNVAKPFCNQTRWHRTWQADCRDSVRRGIKESDTRLSPYRKEHNEQQGRSGATRSRFIAASVFPVGALEEMPCPALPCSRNRRLGLTCLSPTPVRV